MEIIALALIIGLAVACVVFIVSRIFVGSEGGPNKLLISAGVNLIAEARRRDDAI